MNIYGSMCDYSSLMTPIFIFRETSFNHTLRNLESSSRLNRTTGQSRSSNATLVILIDNTSLLAELKNAANIRMRH